VEATLDEATAIPDGFYRTAFISERGNRSLYPSSPGFFDADINNARTNSGRAPSCKLGDWCDRSTIFVAARKIEEKFSHTLDP